jgi:hypothetical protein
MFLTKRIGTGSIKIGIDSGLTMGAMMRRF